MSKFVPFLVILVSLASCQEDDELKPVNSFENKVQIFEKTVSDADEEINNNSVVVTDGNENTSSLKDNDPPVKNGDHWKN